MLTDRYEIRGSRLYDLTEQRPVSTFEAGDILNAHQVLLVKEGVWAAKAGLAEGRADKLVGALEAEVAWLDRPFGMHTYNKGGIHEGDCAACAQRERLRSVLHEVKGQVQGVTN